MNNFKNYDNIDTQIKDRYLLKLAPDFSVFDTAEKVLSSLNENTVVKGVFGRWNLTESPFVLQTPFRRGIFKVFDTSVDITNTDALYSKYEIGDDGFSYIIALNDQGDISLTFDNPVQVVGVAF